MKNEETNPLIKHWRPEDEGEGIYNKETDPKNLMKTSEELSGLGKKDLIAFSEEVKTCLDALRKKERFIFESNPSSDDLKEIRVEIEGLAKNEKLVEKFLAERGISMTEEGTISRVKDWKRAISKKTGFYNRETTDKALITEKSKEELSCFGEKDLETFSKKVKNLKNALEGRLSLMLKPAVSEKKGLNEIKVETKGSRKTDSNEIKTMIKSLVKNEKLVEEILAERGEK